MWLPQETVRSFENYVLRAPQVPRSTPSGVFRPTCLAQIKEPLQSGCNSDPCSDRQGGSVGKPWQMTQYLSYSHTFWSP
jgi:hypothetical protein